MQESKSNKNLERSHKKDEKVKEKQSEKERQGEKDKGKERQGEKEKQSGKDREKSSKEKEGKEKIVEKTKERKPSHNEKYYKIKADFSYLVNYDYKITKEIGRGGYGVVYKAVNASNPNLGEYAIKINFNTVSRELIYAEMAFLMLVKNKSHLPRLVNIFLHQDVTHIVLEYFKFKPFITFFNTFSIEDVKHYVMELLLGLKNLKDLGIYHRDIKPGNFLYNPDTRKGIIIDFGLAEIDPTFEHQLSQKQLVMKQNSKDTREIEEQIRMYRRLSDCLKVIGKNKIGTETYMPLESILHHQNQNYQSDIWPVGVILLQFAIRKYNIFNNVRMMNKPNNIKNFYYINYIIELANFFGQDVVQQCRNLGYELKLPKDIEIHKFQEIANIEGYDKLMDDLLYKLLALNPEKRITVEQALQHPFFESVREAHQPQ